MLKRLIKWLKSFFRSLFGRTQTPVRTKIDVQKQPPPPLTDTDLEFLFTELLEGVHQARGQLWALKWLHNIENRVSTERWVQWLRHFSEKLLASPAPNNELAARMVQLGELQVGDVGDVAYDIGMQLLTRNQPEPIWEYAEPATEYVADVTEESYHIQGENTGESTLSSSQELKTSEVENLPEGEYQTISVDELFNLLQQDENLRLMLSQQLGIHSDDPTEIVEALVQQLQIENQSTTDMAEG